MKKSKLLGWAFIALASLSACTDNADDVLAGESEIRLTSEITPSRVTSLDYQSTQIVPGQEVGITITGAKAAHKNVAWRVGEDGVLTNTGDPVFWGNEDVVITAYHPYNSAWTGTSHEFSVSTDQSDHANYRNSDLLWAMTTSSMTKTAIPLVFEHKLAKVNVTLRSEDIVDLSGAGVSICGTNVTTSFNPTTGSLSATATDVQEIKAGETTSSAYTASAIVVPQMVANGTKFIKIVLGDKTFYYTLSTDKELRAGYSHNYTLTIKDMEVTAESDKITDWEDDDNEGDAEINGDIEKEKNLREALIKLYQSTGGENWKQNDNWCSDKPIEEWYGVTRLDNGKYELDLSNNNLTGKIEQTFPDDLFRLICSNNQLTSLDVAGCTSLWYLYCVDNQLTSLDVSGCTSLVELYCHNNQLTSLDISGCTTLKHLSCDNNQLPSLDVSGCTLLEYLGCYNNQLPSLDISSCTTLKHLFCDSNQLPSLDISSCTLLESLNCSNNQLTSLDVSGFTSLEYLYCYENQLTSLDVSGCTSLVELRCQNNQISSVIPDWFSQLTVFLYDQRYTYSPEYTNEYKDNGYGWWYPGEPEKGYHGRD